MFEHIIKRGILTTVITAIICVLGLLATTRIPVQMIPDLDVRVISVRTVWPGATPQDVEKEILIEQEEYLRNLPSVSRIIASANRGRSEIELEFPFGTDITEMLIRVNNALSQVPSYPEAVDQPRIYANSFSSNSFMFFSITTLPGNPQQVNMDVMRDFIEDRVKPRVSQVPGISEVGVRGGAERQLQILVDPERLALRELTFSDVRNAVRNRNRDRSAGDIVSGKRQYLLRTVGRFEDIEAVNNLILERRGDAVIRLRDVADVRLDHFEKDDATRFNGNPQIMVAVRREAGSNVIDIKQAILKELELINQDILFPRGLQMQLTAEDVTYVEESIKNVWQNLILGSVLAISVMFLFLRSLRTTAIGVMGIPICIIVAFFGLLVLDRTINVISLAGIAFAIGMTLDNSIVVLESIEFERKNGLDRWRAAVEGVKRVWPAVFASTMTTVLVFLPVGFVKEEAGQLYSDVAIAISFAILASMLVAITLLPTAAARLRIEKPRIHATHRWGEKARATTLNCVHWLLSTKQRRLSCIILTFLLSGATMIGLTPPAEYLPEGEEPKLFASMIAPPGYNLDTLQKIADELQDYFLPAVKADPEAYHRGEADIPAMKYLNLWVRRQGIRIIAEPMAHADIEILMDHIAQKYREYPGMRAFVSRGSIITSNNGGTRSINLDISGADLDDNYAVASAAYRRAREVFNNPRIQTSPSSLTLAQPMVEIHPNWQRAAELGISADELGFTVSALTDGSYVDEFFLADDKIDMYLYSKAGQNAELDNLPELPIYTPSGAVLPLSALAQIREQVDTNTVRRVNGSRTVTLNIIPPRSVPLETGVAMVRNNVVKTLRENGAIPAGVNLSISGAADQLDATRASLTSNYAVALAIIYLLLVAIFSHWGYPLLIMLTIPLGVAGGIIGLWLLNAVGGKLPLLGLPSIAQPFDMISMLGFLILMGTVVNNPILIVHRALNNIKGRSMAVVDAVNEAVDARMRPIAMSTITTLFGLAPLVFMPGAGSELYRGVGIIVMFGIIGAAVVTLTMLPALLTSVLEYSRRR